jgi:hypothetical protein
MRSLRDAGSAVRSLFQGLGPSSQGQRHLTEMDRALNETDDRLTAIEEILWELTHKAGVSADDVVKTALSLGRIRPHPQGIPTNAETQIHRILG